MDISCMFLYGTTVPRTCTQYIEQHCTACTAWPSSGLSQCVTAVLACTMESNGSGASVWLICDFNKHTKSIRHN